MVCGRHSGFGLEVGGTWVALRLVYVFRDVHRACSIGSRVGGVETVATSRLREVVTVEAGGRAALFREGVCIRLLAGVASEERCLTQGAVHCVECVPLRCRLHRAGGSMRPVIWACRSCLHEW